LIALLFEVLDGEIEGFHERGQRLLLIVWPQQIGCAQQNGDAMDRVVERACDEDLLFGGVESVIARAEGGDRFLLRVSRQCHAHD